jgi:hypothetical protein
MVNVDILVPPNISVSINKSVDIYKSFDLEDYELLRVSDIYNEIDGKELWFLDSENKEVLVESITKQKYDGVIYDVDVPSYDVILVRRKAEGLQNPLDSYGENSGEVPLEVPALQQELGPDSGKDFDILQKIKTAEF